MTQDEIIEMAKEAGLGFLLQDNWMYHEQVEALAKLVAEHEREACAKVCWWLAGEFDVDSKTAIRCTDAIRARGQT